MIWYIIIVAFFVLLFTILFGAGVFQCLDSPDSNFSGGEGWGLNEPQPRIKSLTNDCIWHINAYIEQLETKPEEPGEVGAAVYEALSEWISLRYEQEQLD